MKFGQLIEYNFRKSFLEESYAKCGGETTPDFFLKSQIWEYLWINSLKIYTVCFNYICQVENNWNISKLSCRPLAFTSYKAFLFLITRGLELALQSQRKTFEENISRIMFY